MNNIKKIQLTYKEISTLVLVVNMYCNGPQYYDVKKTLSKNSKNRMNGFADYLLDTKDFMRESCPELFMSRPYPLEALNKSHEFSLTKDKISMLLTIFIETMKESERDNYFELELLAASIDDVRKVYELLCNCLKEE